MDDINSYNPNKETDIQIAKQLYNFINRGIDLFPPETAIFKRYPRVSRLFNEKTDSKGRPFFRLISPGSGKIKVLKLNAESNPVRNAEGKLVYQNAGRRRTRRRHRRTHRRRVTR
jgi:hypothetical protein